MIKAETREDIPFSYTGLVVLWGRLYVYVQGKMGECPYPDNDTWRYLNITWAAWISLDSDDFQDWIKVFYETFGNDPVIRRELTCYMLGSKDD
jgi:hypothetical protein